MDKIILAYCRENADIAENLDQKLQRIGIPFEHITNQPGAVPGQFAAWVQSTLDPVILIITDNFLKNIHCMASGLTMLRQLVRNQRVLPLVADGRIERDGVWVNTPTQFDRVIHAIQYLNYWQSTFLELRTKRDTATGAEASSLDERLDIVRDIAGEIGEFLNLLRDAEFVRLADLQANDFELFFRKFGISEWHEQYRQLAAFDSDQDIWQHLRISQQPTAMPHLDELPQPDVSTATPPPPTPQPERAQEKPIAQPEELVVPSAPNAQPPAPAPVFAEMDDLIDEIVREEAVFHLSDDVFPAAEPPAADPDFVPPIAPVSPDFPTVEPPILEEDLNGLPAIEISQKIENQTVEPNPSQPESTSQSLEVVLANADFWLEKGEGARALQLLDVALNAFPNDEILRKKWLFTLAKTNRLAEASHFLDHHFLENGRPNAANFELRGDLALAAGDVLEAKDNWEKSAFLEPARPGIYLKLGELTDRHFRGGKKSAAEYFKMAAEQDPENPAIHYRLASTLLEHLDKPKKAIRYLLNTVALEKNHPSAWFDLAVAYREIGENDKAETCYRRAIAINPTLRTAAHDRQFLLAFSEKKDIPTDKNLLTVLVTGATSGIGRATAEIFAQHGHRVILAGRRAERLTELKNSFSESYKNLNLVLPFDVRHFEQVKSALDSLPEDWQHIDLLINNAGLAKGLDPIHEGNLEHWETMIDTNLKGLLYVTRLVSAGMVARQRGHIINVGSSAGKEVYPKGNVYCATKFAVDALSRAMRLDLHVHNIRVSQVSPGHVEETEFALNRFDGDAERAKIYEDFQPLRAQDVAEAIYFMATRPPHVNIQDLYLFGSQQANSTTIHRSGRS